MDYLTNLPVEKVTGEGTKVFRYLYKAYKDEVQKVVRGAEPSEIGAVSLNTATLKLDKKSPRKMICLEN